MQYSEYTFNWVGWYVKWWCLVFVAVPCQVCEWKSRWNSTDLEAPPAAAVEVHPAEHVCHYSRVSLCSCEPAWTKVGLILVKMPSWFWFCNSTEWARFSFGIKSARFAERKGSVCCLSCSEELSEHVQVNQVLTAAEETVCSNTYLFSCRLVLARSSVWKASRQQRFSLCI